MRKSLVFSSFYLKIFALFFMTIDHIGLLLATIPNASFDIVTLSNAFRILGRLALPLFIFMIVEGVLHTKSFSKYCLRLGVIALIISIALICIQYIPTGYDTSSLQGVGNIFLDLLLTAITIYLLKSPKSIHKLFILLPLAISIISFAVKAYEFTTRNEVLWYPSWLYLQYDWVSILLGIGFYYSKKLGDIYINKYSEKNGVDRFIFDNNGTTQLAINLLSAFTIVVVSIAHYFTGYLLTKPFYDYQTQTYAMLSGAFVLFYNGKRGYNAKWFQYGCYIYYLLLMAILIGIGAFIG